MNGRLFFYLAFGVLNLSLFGGFAAGRGAAQTTAFTYQGRFTDATAAQQPTSGTYNMQFALYGSPAGGDQVGATVSNSSVQVVNGVFTVVPDFGANAFPGADRFLEIRVFNSSAGAFVTLTPRQQITSSPYSIRTISAGQADSLSANCAGCVTSAQINSLDGAKITGAVANATTAVNVSGVVGTTNGGTGLSGAGVAGNFLRSNGTIWTSSALQPSDIPAGSNNYIQNRLTTGTAQTGANFYIGGSGRIDTSFSVGGALQTGDTVSFSSSSARPWALSAYSSFNGGALFGRINSSNNTTFAAVQGEYEGSNSSGAGVRGFNYNPNGFGIIGVGNSANAGTLLSDGGGLAAIGLKTGVYAKSTDTSIAASQAIYTVNDTNIVRVNYWNGTTQFKIQGTGTVSTIVRDAENKRRVMFAPEAPEVLLEDYGVGQLVNGRARIEIDPIFARNIAVSEKRPLKVFIQLEGDCNGVYVTNKSANGFDVIELAGGKSNVSFSWHIVANRADEELEGDSSQKGDTKSKRTSRYADLRFPVQDENLRESGGDTARNKLPK
jgi:hypothetical protein